MAWNDKPTDAQIITILGWISRHLTPGKANKAMDYLRENANRREVSQEMGRLRDLYYDHALNSKNIFESKIWDGFEYDDMKLVREFLKNARV